MTARRWQITVDRVVLRGVPTGGLDAAEIGRQVREAVSEGLSDAPLPAGRAMRATVVVEAGAVAGDGGAAIGRAVGGAIVRAATGGPSRG